MSAAEIEVHIPQLRRYARAFTGNAHSADDLVQDCLERALSRLTLWRKGSNLRAWLFTIMRNLWINEIRRRAANPPPGSLDDVAPPVSAAAADGGLIVRDLAAALAALSPEQREVVLLVGLEGMSYAETARIIGAPLGTVMSRLKRGRERLAALMNGEPGLRMVK